MSRTPAAQRLLDAAGTLFDRRGIRAVGIDLLLAEAGVSKATMYEAFGSKDALVLAYLERADVEDRRRYRAAAEGRHGVDRVLVSFELAQAGAARRAYRGCLYQNALTEFPDAGHPVSQVVTVHRQWLQAQWAEGLGGLFEPERVERLVAQAEVLYDGALAASKATRSAAPVAVAADLFRTVVAVPA